MIDPQNHQPRILVVEDEWLIVDLIEGELQARGFAVAGPASTVNMALALVGEGHLDAAVLDVGLGGERSFEVARALADHQVPFVFMTGYTHADLPAEFKERPILNKPFSAGSLGLLVQSIVVDGAV